MPAHNRLASLPSRSVRRAPDADAKNRGVGLTAPRMLLLTPPARYDLESANDSIDAWNRPAADFPASSLSLRNRLRQLPALRQGPAVMAGQQHH